MHDPVWVIRAVFGPQIAPLAIKVARCESGLRWDAWNPSGSRGLFQILGGPWPIWQNTRLAHHMYLERGWEPWTASQPCWE